MAEANPTVETVQNNAKAKNKRNRKPQSNYSKPKGGVDTRQKGHYDMPPTQVQIDPSLDQQTGVARTNFSVSGNIQPPASGVTVYAYLYQRVSLTRWPQPANSSPTDSNGNWTIPFGNVPTSMVGPCWLKAYITSPEAASDMISLSFAQ
jgi:hypothetical protein